jgi:hypothetical protein
MLPRGWALYQVSLASIYLRQQLGLIHDAADMMQGRVVGREAYGQLLRENRSSLG